MQDLAESITLMQELHTLGVGLHMDDFGCGYSSFKYLSELPFDTLKIDRSFLKRFPTDVRVTSVVEGILALSRTLGLRVVAEGIEEEIQADVLESMRCDVGQGYFFDQPISSEEFRDRVSFHRSTCLDAGSVDHLEGESPLICCFVEGSESRWSSTGLEKFSVESFRQRPGVAEMRYRVELCTGNPLLDEQLAALHTIPTLESPSAGHRADFQVAGLSGWIGLHPAARRKLVLAYRIDIHSSYEARLFVKAGLTKKR